MSEFRYIDDAKVADLERITKAALGGLMDIIAEKGEISKDFARTVVAMFTTAAIQACDEAVDAYLRGYRDAVADAAAQGCVVELDVDDAALLERFDRGNPK